MPALRDAAPTSLVDLSATEQVPIAELLRHVATELRGLCSTAYEVESAIEPLITDRCEKGLDGMQGLQELDRLIQYVDGLAAYLGALSEACSDLGSIDPSAARKLVKVARLAEGLAGHRRKPQVQGDVELL